MVRREPPYISFDICLYISFAKLCSFAGGHRKNFAEIFYSPEKMCGFKEIFLLGLL